MMLETHECDTPLLHTLQQGGAFMERYDVTLNGEIVGKVCATREGLYTRFQCHCQLPDAQMYRLHMICDGQKLDLGVCVPAGTQFGVNKSLQTKQIGDGEKKFCVVCALQNNSSDLVPVSTDTAFEAIFRLEHARLYRQNGQYGILFDN